MKVVEPGREQKGWAKEFRCTGEGNDGGGCGALLLVEQADVYITESSARCETTTYHTFKCPQCGVETDIPKSIRLPFRPMSKSAYLTQRISQNPEELCERLRTGKDSKSEGSSVQAPAEHRGKR